MYIMDSALLLFYQKRPQDIRQIFLTFNDFLLIQPQ